MKIIIIILFAQFASNLVLCQYIPTVEEGKEWTVDLSYGQGNHQLVRYTVACDTLIQGNNYYGIYDGSFKFVGFIREDISKQEVYYRKTEADNEELFLVYDVQPGDTIHFNGFEVTVMDVRTDYLFDKFRKVIEFNPLLSFIEGAGSSRYGIVKDYELPFPWPSLFNVAENQSTCEAITSTLNISDSTSTKLFPNPFTDLIHITNSISSSLPYEVFDTYGKSLLRGTCNEDYMVDTHLLAPGLYIINMGGSLFKIIKQ